MKKTRMEKELEKLIEFKIKKYGDIFIDQLNKKEKRLIKKNLKKKNFINYNEIMCNRISVLQELKFA